MNLKVLISSVCLIMAALPQAYAEDHSHNELQSKVYKALADLTVLRDRVERRYAMMMQGETQRISRPNTGRVPLTILRLYKFFAENRQSKFVYHSFGQVLDPAESNSSYPLQNWAEFYRCGSRSRGRRGTASLAGYTVREKDQTISDFKKMVGISGVAFDPFDDLVMHPMYLLNSTEQNEWIERVYLQSSRLLEVREVTQGNLESHWRWKEGQMDFGIVMIQSKAHNYLPIELKFTSHLKQKPEVFGETKIEWKKHPSSGIFLPRKILAVAGNPGGGQEHHHWVFTWKIGNEIKDTFFDCNSDDFRLQFTPVFDFHFDTFEHPGGLVLGTPWQTPKEILKAEESQ